MTAIKVNKIEAAQRQIDAAIRMLFEREDPIAILTLISAAERILRDICAQKNTPTHQRHLELLRPGMEKEFWAAVNRPANFLKHADKDPEGVLDDIDERANDFKILMACFYYSDLDLPYTQYMHAFSAWFPAINPHLIREEHAEIREIYGAKEFEEIRNGSRDEQLQAGHALLKQILRTT